MPKVSVIIPSYNCAQYITEAIDSVLNQTYKNFEVIVIDDGSIDNTKKILEPYIKSSAIRYFFQKNSGPSIARNKGILNSAGEYIAFLDSDDLWMSEKLGKQISYLEQYKEIGLIHSNLSIMTGAMITKKIFQTIERNREGNCFQELFMSNFINMPTVIIRRKCLSRVGLFDPDIKGREDYELWLRISRDFKIGYINEPLSIYRLHDLNKSKNKILASQEMIKTIEKILILYPETQKEISSKLIKWRLFEIYFEAAYVYFKLGKIKESRVYFLKAWKSALHKINIFLYFISTFLPLFIIVFIRKLKQKFCVFKIGIIKN